MRDNQITLRPPYMKVTKLDVIPEGKVFLGADSILEKQIDEIKLLVEAGTTTATIAEDTEYGGTAKQSILQLIQSEVRGARIDEIRHLYDFYNANPDYPANYITDRIKELEEKK